MKTQFSLDVQASLLFGDNLKPYPAQKNILLLPNETKVSTIFGMGYASGLVTAFKAL